MEDKTPNKKIYLPDSEILFSKNQLDLNNKRRKKSSIFFRIILGLITSLLLFIILLFSFYIIIVQKLPDVSDLRSKASQFETLRIMDRQENLLYEVVPPDTGRRDYVTLDKISSYVLASVIAVEDRDYYNHPGFDLIAIIRAFFQNIEGGQTVSGASTITQQLARNLLLSNKERMERTISRKIKEIILAAEITRRYSKDEILEIYLNENYYGNHAYGIEAAAQTYFKISAKNLDFAQAAFLVGLPQAPGYYDIFSNREVTLERLNDVLLLVYNHSRTGECINVRSGAECVSINPLMINDAIKEIEEYNFEPNNFDILHPHWVNYVYQLLETQFSADELYRSGYTIYTTLDPKIQEIAEKQLKSQISSLSDKNVFNGAVIVLQPATGDILAMVGSPDYNDTQHAGQINMAVSPRQPGSAIKPLIYAAAFEKGWNPATLIWDVETDFSPTGKEEDLYYSAPYHPVNYDGGFHGPVLARSALASSLNIPAVKALQYVGIYDNPDTELVDGFIPFAKRFHIDSLDKAGFGLALALGGGEVTLLELTNAFAAFSNNGSYIASRAILKITDHNGNVIFDAPQPLYENVLQDNYAYQISSILSDDSARTIGFGTGSILNLSYPAAIKTGTTNDYRDNWTVGYNTQIAIGVWVGNADNQPMYGTTGLTGAAPIWNSIMESAAAIYPEIRSGQFIRPDGIKDVLICTDSGTLPDENCINRRWEIFADGQEPLPDNQGLIGEYLTDTWSGKLASNECVSSVILKKYLNVSEPEARLWIRNTPAGRLWADRVHATSLDFIPDGDILRQPCGYPVLEIVSPFENMVISDDKIDIAAVVYALDGVYNYSVEFTELAEPENWRIIQNNLSQPHYGPEKIAEWDLTGLDNGDYLVKIRMSREKDLFFERIQTVHIERDDERMEDWKSNYDDFPSPEAENQTMINEFQVIDEDYFYDHAFDEK